MLADASIIKAMRRPGNVTCCCCSCVYGSASASMKKGRPASASSMAPCRRNGTDEERAHDKSAGNPIWPRPGRRPNATRTTATPAESPTNTISITSGVQCQISTNTRLGMTSVGE